MTEYKPWHSWSGSAKPPTFKESPWCWRHEFISESVLREKKPDGGFFYTKRMDVRLSGSYYTDTLRGDLDSEEANYSASLAYWRLLRSGGSDPEWKKINAISGSLVITP